MHTAHSTQHTAKRIEYLDALRGFTMILVVLNHIAVYNLGIDVANDDTFHFYFRQFRMPLFFFVSGFLFYKNNYIWSWKNIKDFLSKKVVVQIISPLIFLLCYIQYKDFPFIESLTSASKKGYWFTYALFNYFVLYIAIKKLLNTIKVKESTILIVLLLIGIIQYYINIGLCLVKLNVPESIVNIFSLKSMQYFFFFVIGTSAKKYFTQVENILTKSHFLAIVIILYFTLNIFVDTTSLSYILTKTLNITLSICGIAITFGFFKKHEDAFSNNSRVANTLKFIGKRTLDIYLIHTFFFSDNLPQIFPFFTEHNLPLIEFTTSLIMTAIVITACLFISSILRINDTLAHYLFGAKKK